MPDPKKLPFILQFLDEDTPVVRSSVAKELASFKDSLADELARLDPPATAQQREQIQQILTGDGRRPKDFPIYRLGQLVRHKLSHYRGLVVHLDLKCQLESQGAPIRITSPAEDQPWYRVFIDNSDQEVYAPQSDLVADESIYGVMHPLIPYFFTLSREGKYLRNTHSWPG